MTLLRLLIFNVGTRLMDTGDYLQRWAQYNTPLRGDAVITRIGKLAPRKLNSYARQTRWARVK